VTVTEDVATAVTGISFADVDACSEHVQASLSATWLALRRVRSRTVTVGGTATALTLTGSTADIDAFIAGSGLTFKTALNSDADRSEERRVGEEGSSPGPAEQSNKTVTMHVTPVNDTPDLTLTVVTG